MGNVPIITAERNNAFLFSKLMLTDWHEDGNSIF